jgi:hypothetical protein
MLDTNTKYVTSDMYMTWLYQDVRMETDRIRIESDLDSTFYHILTRLRIRIRIFSNPNAKRMSRIRIRIWIFTQYIG